jgi:protein-L-isoaspartate(D-aspartate) O-methyltransferase
MLRTLVLALLVCACRRAAVPPAPLNDSAVEPGHSAPSSGDAPGTPSPASLPPAASKATKLRADLVSEIQAQGDVRSGGVLAALRQVERHRFMPHASLEDAYTDRPFPIGHEQTISQPTIVGMMTEALELSGTESVLEIGTGSGYQAAVLAILARDVRSIEIVPELGHTARERLKKLGYANVQVRVGDGYAGWPEAAPFDRILLTAAPPKVPQALVDQLKEGGVLVAPVGPEGGVQTLFRYRKQDGKLTQEPLSSVRFVPMVQGK